MKENSIEETIKQLKLILKVRKEQKEIIEYAGGSCINCDPDIQALTNSIEFLSDYKRVLKENEELKEYIMLAPNLDEMTAIKYRNIQKEAYIRGRAEEQKKTEQIIYENYIPIQKIKDEIEEYKKISDKIYREFVESNRYDTDLRDKGIKCDAIVRALQELLERNDTNENTESD